MEREINFIYIYNANGKRWGVFNKGIRPLDLFNMFLRGFYAFLHFKLNSIDLYFIKLTYTQKGRKVEDMCECFLPKTLLTRFYNVFKLLLLSYPLIIYST